MTATALQGTQQATAQAISDKEWVRLFPKEMTENYTSSVTFIKQLTVVAVSTITYLKNAFPEDSYYSDTFGGLRLKLLKDHPEDALAQFMSTSMKQAFHAFDRKYVHQFVLCFYRGACSAENLIEYHVFEYAYSAAGVELTINSKNRESVKHSFRCSVEAVRKRTAMMLRSLSLFVWQNCTQELPDNYDVSLRLYYNDDAPEEYQAPGFGPSLDPDHLAGLAHENVCVGWVETPFHKLIARCYVRDAASDSDVAVPSDKVPEMTQDGSEDYLDWGAAAERPRLRCPCGGGGSARDALVTCQYCHMQQHAVCFGLLSPTPEHCCEACAGQEQDRAPSCQLLVGLERRKQESLCHFRRALLLCAGRAALGGAELRAALALGAANAASMLRLLGKHAVLADADPHDPTLPRKINPIRLKLVLKRFFRVEDQEDSLEESLVAETERPASPVGTALGLGAPQPSPAAAAAAPDALMQQYRAALAGGADAGDGEAVAPDALMQEYRAALAGGADAGDELPLSGDHNPVAAARLARRPKRKAGDDEGEDWTPSKLRSGTKTNKKL